MQIFIKLLNGESFSLDVEQNETIEDVKIKILEKRHIKVSSQRLMFKKLQLEDDKSLIDYNIFENSTIYLILRLHGGEFGAGSAHIFTDPEKVKPKGIKFSDKAPFYRTVFKRNEYIRNL